MGAGQRRQSERFFLDFNDLHEYLLTFPLLCTVGMNLIRCCRYVLGGIEMVKSRVLGTEDELLRFIEVYYRRAKIRPDLEYLKRSLVKIFYQPSGEWVGGYIVNTNSPYRYLQDIPQPTRDQRLAEANIKQNEAAEITCIWIDRKRIPYVASAWIYWSSVNDAVKSGRKYVIGASVVNKVAKRHMMILPYLLYFGDLECQHGAQTGWVYYGKSQELWRIFLVAFVKEASMMAIRSPVRVLAPLLRSRSSET